MSNLKEIPKIIHQIWIGGDIPAIQALYMARWQSMEGWKYVLWRNDKLTKKNFPVTWHLIKKVMKIGEETGKNKYAQLADIMRLEILLHHGGVYADTTMEPLKPLDGLFTERKMYLCNEDRCGFECKGKNNMLYISNSFFAAPPRHPVLKRLLKELENADFLSSAVNIETGPYFIGRNIKGTDKSVVMLDTDLFYPHGYENKYREEDEPDQCFAYTEQENTTVQVKNIKRGTQFISYPCRRYKNSYAIKHWEVGGTWL